MNQLSAELRTPPLPAVAFINCAELHKDIGTYFNTNLRPPLFFVSLPEANEAVLARLFGTPHPPKPFSTPDGILKADWISKQRTRRASVAVTCVLRSDVEGDPTSWMRMTRGLQAVKAASAHKGVWLVLVVVQDGPVSDLPQDRITGLWNSFEPKQLVIISRSLFDPDIPLEQRRQLQDEQLRPLQQLVVEAAAAYYTAAAGRQRQKQLDLTTTLGSCPPEISAAIAFKLAVFAEFRQDWQGAVTCYQATAAALQAVPLGRPTVSCQRHAEVAAVAEVAHFKAMMLLLHQQRHAEAVQQLATHLAVFGRIPDGLPLPAAATHYGWLARQYQAAAEMITGSRMDAATLQAHPEAEPCHLLMSAAQLALARKNLVDQLSQMSQGPPAFDTSSVKKGRYLGQYERKQPEGPTHSSDLTDAEFCSFLEAEERRVNHCQVVLDLLLQAQAAHLKEQLQQPTVPPGVPPAPGAGTGSRRSAADRVSARLAYLIAEQQMETHNLTAARKLLLQVAYTCRRDGWDALLLHSLLLLRDVCQRLKLHKEALLHSLEVASLAGSLRRGDAADAQAAAPGLFDSDQARGLASAALLALLAGPQDNKSSLKKPAPSQQQPQPEGQQPEQQQQPPLQQGDAQGQAAITSSPRSSSSGSWEYEVQQLDLAAALQLMPASQEDGAAHSNSVAEALLLHKQQDFGWAQLISVSGGFVQHSPDPEQLHLAVGLRNNLPVALPLGSAVLTLSDAQGNWQQPLQPGPCTASSTGSSGSQGQTGSAGAAAATDVTAGFSDLQLTERALQQAAHSQQRPQAGWPIQLEPGAWQQLHVVFTPRCIGTVACEHIELRLSDQCRVMFKVQSFAPGKPLLGSSVVGQDSPFNLKQQVKLGTWTAKVQHVGHLPQVQVLLPELLLVGEFVPVDIRVAVSAVQPAATLELSVRTTSGVPPSQLTLLAALPDGKLHELSLQGQLLTVPKLAAGSVWVQHLWARSRDGTGCRLTATLSCPALVLQHADLSFRPPFEHRVRLSAEAGVHTLVGPSAAFAAVNGCGLSSAAAVAAAGGSVSGGGGAQAGVEPGASGAVPLVVGQSLFAQVLVATGHAADLLLLGADLQLEAGSQLKLLNDVSQQLAPHALIAGTGSVHCLLLHLLPTGKATTPSSIGKLQLSWRRKRPAAVAAHHQGSGSSGGGSGAGSSATLAAEAAMERPSPTQDVETSLELPQVVLQDSLLSIKASGPQNVTAGASFAYTLQVHNLTTQPQEVQVSVQEAQGFVFAGSKQQVVNVVPRTIHSITWTLVAHASGQMQLPAVRVIATKLGCSTVTQGGTVHVLPY